MATRRASDTDPGDPTAVTTISAPTSDRLPDPSLPVTRVRQAALISIADMILSQAHGFL
jgi:hypothetical protein